MQQPSDGSDLPSRFTRLEEFTEFLKNSRVEFEDEYKRLLRAQAVAADMIREVAAAQVRAETRMHRRRHT